MSQHSPRPPRHGTGIPSPGSPQAGRDSRPRGISSGPSPPSAGGFEQSLTSATSSDQAVVGALLLSAFPLLEGKQPLPQELVQGLHRDIPSPPCRVRQPRNARAPGVGVGQLQPGSPPGTGSRSATEGSGKKAKKGNPEGLQVGSWWDQDGFEICREQGCVFPAGLSEPALFSCEAHNSKGLTASSPGQVNIKGQLPFPVKPQVSTLPGALPSEAEGEPGFNPIVKIQRDLVVVWSSQFGHPSTGVGEGAPKMKFESKTVSFKVGFRKGCITPFLPSRPGRCSIGIFHRKQ